MKYSISFFFICVLSFIVVFSCSTDEEESVTPVVQTPQPEPEPEPVEYTLTVSAAEGGTVSSEGGTYDEGSEVTITASASEGYRFTGWEGNSSTSESLTVTLNSNQTYLALFELIPIYTLTVTTGEGGTVSTEGGEYQEGTEVTITATPDQGYEFVGWTGAIESTELEIQILVNEAKTISAVFSLITNASDYNPVTQTVLLRFFDLIGQDEYGDPIYSESPTIIPLEDENKVAIHALCQEPVFWETMEELKINGASSILVMPIEKVLN